MPKAKLVKSKQKTNKAINRRVTVLYSLYTLLLVALLILVLWAMTSVKAPTDSVATPQEIEQAKHDISELFTDRRVDHCPHQDLPETQNNQYGYVISHRYLRINETANRAIISSCNNSDTLLAKTSAGTWIETDVNVMIDNRVNPVWQKECMIEHITVADDTVRPENSHIDEMNLQLCRQLKQDT